MTELGARLELLGLSQYCDSLVAEGFDTWETLLDITESDLTYLNFKLGHRRKLQRAIAESRGQPADRALVNKPTAIDGAYRSDDSGTERRGPQSPGNPSAQTSASNTGTKRKYRRHPKTDSNAPERPPSAYVIFSNQVREDLKGQELTFTEIAKVVGERWQVLPAEVRENYEQQANSAKERYYSAMSDYKKTPEYAQYQAYLADFKAKHGTSRTDGKRSKMETEASSASEPALASAEPSDRARLSRSAPQLSTSVPRSSASSPSTVAGGVYGAVPRRPSPSTSAVWSEVVNSPGRQEPFSPEQSPTASGSRMSAREQRAATRRTPAKLVTRDMPYDGPQYQGAGPLSRYRPSETWPGPETGQPPYLTVLPQREARTVGIVPELTHQDSTISSAGSSQTQTSPLNILPPIDASKVLDRRLPQPVLGLGTRSLPLEPRGPLPVPMPLGSAPNSGPALHGRHGSGSAPDQRAAWPALLQATNLAREAELPSPPAKPEDGDTRPRP